MRPRPLCRPQVSSMATDLSDDLRSEATNQARELAVANALDTATILAKVGWGGVVGLGPGLPCAWVHGRVDRAARGPGPAARPARAAPAAALGLLAPAAACFLPTLCCAVLCCAPAGRQGAAGCCGVDRGLQCGASQPHPHRPARWGGAGQPASPPPLRTACAAGMRLPAWAAGRCRSDCLPSAALMRACPRLPPHCCQKPPAPPWMLLRRPPSRLAPPT